MSKLKAVATLLVGTLMLSACDKQPQVSEPVIKPTPIVKPKPLAASLIPNGHWLANPLHCSKQLPSQGVYDFKIENYAHTFIGITQEGKWDGVETDTYKARIEAFLATEQASCLPNDMSKMIVAKYSAPGTTKILAYTLGTGFVMVIHDDSIDIATRFDMDMLKSFEYVELMSPDAIDDTVLNVAEGDDGVTYEN